MSDTPAVKLTAFQAWVLRERIHDYGWKSRSWIEVNNKTVAAVAALLKKGAIETDGRDGGGEMVRTTDKGRALLDALKEEGEGRDRLGQR